MVLVNEFGDTAVLVGYYLPQVGGIFYLYSENRPLPLVLQVEGEQLA